MFAKNVEKVWHIHDKKKTTQNHIFYMKMIAHE